MSFVKELTTESSLRKVVFVQRKRGKVTTRKHYLLMPHITNKAIRICYSDNQKRFPVLLQGT